MKQYDSVERLRAEAEAWNALWERSDAASPLLRAETVALWKKRFEPNASFYGLVVESDGTFLAALPLVRKRKAKAFRAGMLTENDWSFCGDLLLDRTLPDRDKEAALSCLLDSLQRLPVDLLWLDPIRFDCPPWPLFRERLTAERRPAQWLARYQTAVVPLDRDRETLTASWHKREFGNIRRRFKKGAQAGAFRLDRSTAPERIKAVLPDCFRLEDKGWKGRDGGSILNHGLEDYYTEQAVLLAERGLFRLYTLYYEEKLIAFRYAPSAKGTVFSLKTSYDPDYRDLAPGQMLQWLMIDALIDEADIERLDFMGIAAPHQMIWNPELQTVGQLVLPVSWRGRLFFSLYDTVMPWIRRRRRSDTQTVLKSPKR